MGGYVKANLSKAVTASGLAVVFGLQAVGCANLSDKSSWHQVHLSKEQVNADIAPDLASFLKKLTAAQGKEGWGEDIVFEATGINKTRFIIQNPEKTVEYITGSKAAAQTREAIEFNTNLVKTSKVYTLNFKEVDKHGALVWPFAGQSTKEGHDVEMVLVFKAGVLDRASLYGQQHVNGKETDFIWNLVTGGAIAAGFAAIAITGMGLMK